MPSRLPLVLLASHALLAQAACGQDSAAPDEDRMTRDEANALVQGLYGGTLLAYGETLLRADPLILAALPPGVAFPLESTIPCVGGGETVFSGSATISANNAQDSLAAELSGTLAVTGCTFTGEGVTFTLDSGRGLAQTGTLLFSMETFSFSLDIASSGSFDWTSGTKSGSCGLDNAITAGVSLVDAALSGAVPTATVTGSVCGHGVDREINLTSATP